MGQSVLSDRRRPFGSAGKAGRGRARFCGRCGSTRLCAVGAHALGGSGGVRARRAAGIPRGAGRPGLSKGNRVNIPERERGDGRPASRWVARCGNASELGDVGLGPGKSSLFFVRGACPGIGSPGDRDSCPVKHRGSCGVRCAQVGP
eukprot:XP_002586341.1 hypothetical protein BRAFLDRAFT_132176 [Branchiostoma floridae]